MSDSALEPSAALPAGEYGQTFAFLNAIFGAKDPGEFLLIWRLDDKQSAWFQDLSAAVDYVHRHRTKDVYVGVALSPADYGSRLRLKIEGNERPPSSIVGLWADVDVVDGVHKKQNLPPTVEDARGLFFPDIQPSIVLHTGGGLQAWWLFKELWQLESEEELRRAGALATRWNHALRARATAKSWDLDAVNDLTRVLRVPGSANCKIPGQPRPVQILEINDRRYNPSDLDEYLDMIGAYRSDMPVAGSGGIVVGQLVYNPNAQVNQMKFDLLAEIEPRFRRSWNNQRTKQEWKDCPDQSTSSFAMSLANIAVSAGWTNQEIADLLIAHRVKSKEKDLKLRDTYYLATIRKARELHARQIAAEIPRRDDPIFYGGAPWTR